MLSWCFCEDIFVVNEDVGGGKNSARKFKEGPCCCCFSSFKLIFVEENISKLIEGSSSSFLLKFCEDTSDDGGEINDEKSDFCC